MLCVKSVSFSVLINGEPHGPIITSRGLRQGDPLSPNLFLLCTEDLISLLHYSEGARVLNGIHVCRGAPQVNHLLFAYDSVVFLRANKDDNEQLQKLLEIHDEASGQQVNRRKTSMVFSRNLEPGLQDELMSLLGVNSFHQYEK